MPKLEILLLVEDREADIELTKQVIHKISAGISVVVHSMGETALDYLTAVINPPQLILLDLGLPGMDGIEFIKQMKTIKRLKPIPVVILTGAAMDIARAHAEDVTAFILKPMSAGEFNRILQKLGFNI